MKAGQASPVAPALMALVGATDAVGVALELIQDNLGSIDTGACYQELDRTIEMFLRTALSLSSARRGRGPAAAAAKEFIDRWAVS